LNGPARRAKFCPAGTQAQATHTFEYKLIELKSSKMRRRRRGELKAEKVNSSHTNIDSI